MSPRVVDSEDGAHVRLEPMRSAWFDLHMRSALDLIGLYLGWWESMPKSMSYSRIYR